MLSPVAHLCSRRAAARSLATLLLAGLCVLSACSSAPSATAPPAVEPCADSVYLAAVELARGQPEQCLGLLASQSICRRGQLVRGLALAGLGRHEEAERVLDALGNDRGLHPELRALAWEIKAIGLAWEARLPQRAAGRPAPADTVPLQAASAALELAPRARRARLLRALLLAPVEPERALTDVYALAAPHITLDDPAELQLNELDAWLISIFGDRPGLHEQRSPQARLTLALLLEGLSAHRASPVRHALLRRALELLDAAPASAPPLDGEEAALLAARLHWALDDKPAALQRLRGCLARHPHPGRARLELLRALAAQGGLNEIVTLGAGPPGRCPLCVAEVMAARALLGQACDEAELYGLLRTLGGDPPLTLLTARCLLARGEVEGAVRVLAPLAGGDQPWPAAVVLLTGALARLGRDEEALALATRMAEALTADEETLRAQRRTEAAALAFASATAAIERGDLPAAEQGVQTIVKKEPGHPLLGLLQAAVARARGRTPDRRTLQRVLDAALVRNRWLMQHPGQAPRQAPQAWRAGARPPAPGPGSGP